MLVLLERTPSLLRMSQNRLVPISKAWSSGENRDFWRRVINSLRGDLETVQS